MPARTDPISDGLLSLFEARAAEQKAQIDLDQARAKSSMLGRTAVPGVFAQLQEQRMKQEKQREQIAKQQAQGAPPSSMAPPLTQVTGQTDGRQSGAGLKAVGELVKAVSGGGAIKQGGIAGVFGQQVPGQQAPGTSPGLPGGGPNVPAGGQAAQAPPSGAPAPAPGGQPSPLGPFPPGSLQQPQQPQEPLGRRLGRAGLNVLGGRLGGVALGEELLPEPVAPPIPTVAQQVAPIAKSLAIYQRRMGSTDPVVAAQSEQLYTDGLDQVEQELGLEFRDAAELHANALALEAEEKERLRAEDPALADERAIGRLKADLVEGKVTLAQLTPGQKEVLKLEQQGIGDINVKLLQPGTATELEKRSIQHFDMLNRVGMLEGVVYPEFFKRGAETQVQLLEQLQKTGARLTPKQEEQIQRYRSTEQVLNTITKDVVRAAAGATMAPHEVDLVIGTLFSKDDSWTGFQRKLANFRHLWALDTFRDLTMRGAGISDDPGMARGLPETGVAAQTAANARIAELQGQGLDPLGAEAQAAREFRHTYGLDLQRLFASPNGM